LELFDIKSPAMRFILVRHGFKGLVLICLLIKQKGVAMNASVFARAGTNVRSVLVILIIDGTKV
jgi:hypothetical protein